MDTKGTKPIDCYLRGIKSPERIEPNSNIVGNLRLKPVEDKRADAVRKQDEAFEESEKKPTDARR
jgi:hypothetical protein